MALLNRNQPKVQSQGQDWTDGLDRCLLTVALALAFLTLLAVLDRQRPVPGSERPVEVRILPVEIPLASAAVKPSRLDTGDDLLVHD